MFVTILVSIKSDPRIALVRVTVFCGYDNKSIIDFKLWVCRVFRTKAIYEIKI